MPEDIGIEKFIRPDLADFGGYAARTSPDTLEGKIEVPVGEIIELDANENPYGCSPRVNQALATYPYFSVYPDSGQTELRKLLAGYVGVAPERIVASNGSNQLIDLLTRLLIGEGDEVINCTPTFGIYSFSTRLCGGTPLSRVRSDGWPCSGPPSFAAQNRHRVHARCAECRNHACDRGGRK